MTWMQTIADWLGASSYYGHAICLTNDQFIIGLYLLGDLSIWISYTIIGGSLALTFTGVMRLTRSATVLYGLFIFLCGLSHFTKSLTLFAGVYLLDLAVVLACAAVSSLTAAFTAREAYQTLWSR
jgi:hypothetical protein